MIVIFLLIFISNFYSELVDVDNYYDNVEREDTGGYGDNGEGEEDTGVYADTVYNQESFTQDQQGTLIILYCNKRNSRIEQDFTIE